MIITSDDDGTGEEDTMQEKKRCDGCGHLVAVHVHDKCLGGTTTQPMSCECTKKHRDSK